MVHVLENGMRVILQENHAAPVVALQIWVNRGSADDPQVFSGLAHVLEHMVFKGTSRRAEGQIAKEIEEAGGQINAYTSFDQTVFHVILPSRHFTRGLDILADTLQDARLDGEELERELQVIFEEIRQGEDSPAKSVSRQLFATAYKKHPYGRPVIGYSSTVKQITKTTIQKYFRSWYAPTQMTLIAAGDFSPVKSLYKIKKLFHHRRSNKVALSKRASEPAQQQLRVSIINKDAQEAYIALAFHIPGLQHPDTPALDLAAIILGQGDSSRLVQRIKHEQQLVTDVYAYSYTPRDPGLLILGGTTPPDKLSQALEGIFTEIFSLALNEVSADELRRAKTIVESDAIYQKETVQGQARKLGFYYSAAGSTDFEQEYNQRVLEASAPQIRKVAARYLKPENCSVAVLAPQGDQKEKKLAQQVQQLVRVAHKKAIASHRSMVQQTDRLLKVTLKNGARLIVMRDDSIPLVAMRAVWNGGLRYENEQNNGINSLLASLITRGTQTRSAVEINEVIEGMAGSIGGFSGHNSFGLRAELLARHWDQGLEILSDCILHPAFLNEEVEKERRQILDDIRAQQDHVATLAFQLFQKTLYHKHPYRFDPLGKISSMSSISRSQLIHYYRRHFHPSNMILAVVGDVEPVRVKERFVQLFGGVAPRTERPISPPHEQPRTSPSEDYLLVNKQQAHIVLGFPGTTIYHQDRYALEVLASILSGQGGRLFLRLRDRQGLAYQVGAYSLEGIEPGYFAIYVATSPKNIPTAIAGIQEELNLLRTKSVPQAELMRTKRYLIGSFDISLQRKVNLASLLAFNECYGLGYRAYEKYVNNVNQVTGRKLIEVARRYLDPQKQVTAIVKPEELSPGAAKHLGEEKQAGVAKTDTLSSAGKRKAAPRRKKR